MRLATFVAFLALVCSALSQAPSKIKSGDVLAVIVAGLKQYSGEYLVLNDGSITGLGFGRVVVRGLDIAGATKAVKAALSKVVRDPLVQVTYKYQRPDIVFVFNTGRSIGTASAPLPAVPDGLPGDGSGVGGVVQLKPGMNLRMLLSGIQLGDDYDLLDLQLIRAGKIIVNAQVSHIFDLSKLEGGALLEGDDVITILPKPYVRAYFVGEIVRPGLVRLPVGIDLYQALGFVGGIRSAGGGTGRDSAAETDYILTVRRGPEDLRFPAVPTQSVESPKLQDGDTVFVRLRPQIRVTVAGEINDPGEYVVNEESSINNALARAGGITSLGSLKNILVMRGRDVYKFDASKLAQGSAPERFNLLDGDLVYVRRNERTVITLGEVRSPGRYFLDDGKDYRMTDVLALSGGLSATGSLRRVYLARATPSGKVAITQYNVDEYLKLGKLEANPIIEPDDVVLFGQPKGITIDSLSSVLSPIILIDTLFRRR